MKTANDVIAPVGLTEKLASLLRLLGGGAVLVSLYFFFVKGWQGGDDLMRYGMFLGHTLALVTLALISAHWLKETKGARLLLILSLVSVIGNFSILGSFLFAEFGPPLGSDFLSALRWNLGSAGWAVTLAVLVPLLLIPVIALGFRVLARGASPSMTLLFIASNGLLLLPVREPLVVALLALAAGLYILLFNLQTKRQRIEARTPEGVIALTLQFVPVATLLVRNLWLHDAADILSATAAVLGFITLRQMSVLLVRTSWVKRTLEVLSALLAIIASGFLCSALDALLPNSVLVLSGVLLFGGMFYELSRRAEDLGSVYRFFAALMISVMLMLSVMVNGDWFAQLCLCVTGAVVIGLSVYHKERLLLLPGTAMFVGGLLYSITGLWAVFDMNAWVACALLGVGFIMLASVLESGNGRVRQLWQHYG